MNIIEEFITFLLFFIILSGCAPNIKNQQNNNTTNFNTDTLLVENEQGSILISEIKPNEKPRFKVAGNRKVDGNNIEHIIVRILDTLGRVTDSLDVFHSNPFPLLGLKILSNESSHEFYFLKVPGDGTKKNLKKFFGPEVYDLIPEEGHFEKIYVTNSIEYSTNRFVVLTYALELHLSYYEYYDSGYSTSITLIYNADGDLIYTHKIDGATNNKPIVSADGKYLAYLKVNEYASEMKKYVYNIIRIQDDRLVYSLPQRDLNVHECYSGLDSENSLIQIFLTGKNGGTLLYLDSKIDHLYKLRNTIPGLYSFREIVGDSIEIYFRDKPSEWLSLKKDFDLIEI